MSNLEGCAVIRELIIQRNPDKGQVDIGEILEVGSNGVKVDEEGGEIVTLALGAVRYAYTKVGDKVRIYRDGDTSMVMPLSPRTENEEYSGSEYRRINEYIYIILTILFAAVGVQRFVRGQVGLGIFMLLVGWWITLGIWPLVDMIISLVKLPRYAGDNYIFNSSGRWVK